MDQFPLIVGTALRKGQLIYEVTFLIKRVFLHTVVENDIIWSYTKSEYKKPFLYMEEATKKTRKLKEYKEISVSVYPSLFSKRATRILNQ